MLTKQVGKFTGTAYGQAEHSCIIRVKYNQDVSDEIHFDYDDLDDLEYLVSAMKKERDKK